MINAATDINEHTFWEDLRSGKFARMVKEKSRGQQLNSPNEVFNIVKPFFIKNDDAEQFYCIFLDNKNQLLAIEKIFSGSIASSSIYPRELVKRVTALKANAVVLVHNHPTGCPRPSSEDKMVTRKIAVALGSIDVQLHDHIIIGDNYYSMSEDGIIKNIIDQFNQFLSGKNH